MTPTCSVWSSDLPVLCLTRTFRGQPSAPLTYSSPQCGTTPDSTMKSVVVFEDLIIRLCNVLTCTYLVGCLVFSVAHVRGKILILRQLLKGTFQLMIVYTAGFHFSPFTLFQVGQPMFLSWNNISSQPSSLVSALVTDHKPVQSRYSTIIVPP